MISNNIQMGSSVSLFRNPLPSLALLASFVLFAVCSDFGVLSILITTSALISGAVIFAILRPNSAPRQKSVHRESEDERDETNHAQEKEADDVQFASESQTAITQEKGCQRGEEGYVCDYLLSSPDGSSDTTQSIDHTSASEDSEIEWPFEENQDGTISDEESLIEIALPNGHFVEPKKQLQPKYWPDHCSKFEQQSLMDLLAEINEMNEEENLIEIDISMGSIKCPRFEIQA